MSKLKMMLVFTIHAGIYDSCWYLRSMLVFTLHAGTVNSGSIDIRYTLRNGIIIYGIITINHAPTIIIMGAAAYFKPKLNAH